MSKLVDVLEKSGNIKEALSIAEDSVAAFPEDASLEHRISMLLSNLERYKDSYVHAKRAVDLDDTLREAKLHLASLEARRGNPENAENLLGELHGKLPKRYRIVRDNIRAETKLKQKQFGAARKILEKYDVHSDTYLADVAGRIELFDAMDAMGKGQIDIAADRLKQGKKIIERALKKFSENQSLQRTYKQINKVEESLHKG